MSVAAAMKSAGGVVLGSDSQGTSSTGQMFMRSNIDKVHVLGSHIAYASVGAHGVAQKVSAALGEVASTLSPQRTRDDLADIIERTVNPVQRRAREQWIEMPNTAPPEWAAIFCGWSRDGAWIFEVGPDGQSEFHDRFTAAGSGGPFAHVALVSVRHYSIETKSLVAAKAVIYRAIENTCQASASGVSLPVQMAVVTDEGAQRLESGELRAVEDLVNLLKLKEVETLGELAPDDALDRVVSAADDQPSVSAAEL